MSSTVPYVPATSEIAGELGDGRLPLSDPGIGRTTAPASPTRRRAAFLALGVVLLVAGSVLVGGVRRHRASDPVPTSTIDHPPERVVALGRLRPRGGVIEVAAPTTAAAPRILELLVEEGEHVERDQPLVVLDTHAQLSAAHAAARSAVVVAEEALDQARRDVRAGRKESRAAVDVARIAAERAEREQARSARLFDEAAISPAEMEGAEATASQADAELRRARAVAGRYDDPVDLRLAEANLAAAHADLERAFAELQTAIVRAPSSGTVLSVLVRAGERASTGTLLRIGDLRQMEAELEVFQELVPRVVMGDAVRLESVVLGDEPLLGIVGRVGLEVGRQSLTSTTDPAANTDARVIEVWVDLDRASTARAARFVGLEVIAHISARPRSDEEPS